MNFENSIVSEETKSPEQLKNLNDFKIKLTEGQNIKFDNVYNNLDSKKQDDILIVLPKVGNNVEKFLNHIESVVSKESKNSISRVFDLQREKFKDNDKILEKIYNIEEEILDELDPYVVYNTNYIKLFQEVLLKKGNEEDKEFKEINEMIIQKIHIIEMIKNRIGNLEIQLKTFESEKQKNERYKGLDETFNEIKDDEKLKDIIGEKNFDKLSAGDFYAMLKSNPDKMRGLLLSTVKGEQIDLSNGWDNLKGEQLKVNFGKNKGLDKIIGAGDILDIESVKIIKVNGVEGERKTNPRPGYYTKTGQYLAIHDGYKIEVTDTTKLEGEEEMESFSKGKITLEQARNKRFEDIRGTEVSVNIGSVIEKAINENSKAKKIENPYKSDVDKELIEKIFKKHEYLGVKFDEEGNIVFGDKFNIGHLGEALNGYSKIKNKVIKHLKNNKELVDSKSLELNISDFGYGDNSKFLENTFESIVNNEKVKVSINSEKIIIDSSDTELTIEELFSTGYEYKGRGNRHEKYSSQINAAALAYGIPSGAITQLIYHENEAWNPHIKASLSSAYGLGQMINSTWSRFGSGDRNNPADQLMATAKYMKHIQSNKNCSWEEVLAYYNTGEGILSGKVNINNYYRLNPAISKNKNIHDIPNEKTNRNYFILAIAYYNDLSSFADASSKVNI